MVLWNTQSCAAVLLCVLLLSFASQDRAGSRSHIAFCHPRSRLSAYAYWRLQFQGRSLQSNESWRKSLMVRCSLVYHVHGVADRFLSKRFLE